MHHQSKGRTALLNLVLCKTVSCQQASVTEQAQCAWRTLEWEGVLALHMHQLNQQGYYACTDSFKTPEWRQLIESRMVPQHVSMPTLELCRSAIHVCLHMKGSCFCSACGPEQRVPLLTRMACQGSASQAALRLLKWPNDQDGSPCPCRVYLCLICCG